MRERPGYHAVTLWLPDELLRELRRYQHAHELPSMVAAVIMLLRSALGLAD